MVKSLKGGFHVKITKCEKTLWAHCATSYGFHGNLSLNYYNVKF